MATAMRVGDRPSSVRRWRLTASRRVSPGRGWPQQALLHVPGQVSLDDEPAGDQDFVVAADDVTGEPEVERGGGVMDLRLGGATGHSAAVIEEHDRRLGCDREN